MAKKEVKKKEAVVEEEKIPGTTSTSTPTTTSTLTSKTTLPNKTEEIISVNVTTNEEEVVEHKIPKGVFILKNPAKGNIDIAYEGKIYKLGSGEERLFNEEVGSFLKERYPFLKRSELTAKNMDIIAEAESQVSPLTFKKQKKRGTFDPNIYDKKLGLTGKGVEDDNLKG